MLDMSFVSSATEKQKLDESFQSNATRMSALSQMSQKQREEMLLANAKQREKFAKMQDDLNKSQMSSSRSHRPDKEEKK